MAVAAARKSLSKVQETISSLIFASTTAPFLDRSSATLIAEALSLDEQVKTFESAGQSARSDFSFAEHA